MDYKRLALAAVVAFVVDAIYGVVVWMMLLGNEFQANVPGVFRPEAEMNTKMPLVFAGGLLGIFVLTYIYAKGYEGGNGVKEGARFGLLIGLFILFFVSAGIYGSFNISERLAMLASLASFVEMIVVGTVIGALYRPATVPKRATAPAM